MKSIFLFILLSIAVSGSFAQSNTYPSYGKVGIGTLSPYYRLHVDSGYVFSSTGFITPEYYWIGNGSVGYIRKLNNNIPLHLANAGGVPELTIAGNGNVGIGESNPLYKLDVSGSARFWSGFSNYTPDGLFSGDALPSGVHTPNGNMRIRFGYLDQGGGQYWGRIGFLGNTNWSLGTASGGHSFSIGRHYGGTDLSIDNDGKVGIGIASPSSNLHVYGTRSIATIEATPTGDHASVVIKAAGNNGGGAPSVYFKRGDINYGAIFVERGTGGGNAPMFSGTENTDFVIGTTAEVPIKFGTNGNAKMVLATDGKLGAGSLSPLTALHIDGKVPGGEAASITNTPNGIFTMSTYATGLIASMGLEANVPSQYFWLQPRYVNQSVFYNTVLNPNGGSVGIGTTTPSEKLSVNGNIRAKKILVSQSGWPDYVFDDTYRLRPLSELSAYIQQNKHLPEIPSASEVATKGISVGDNQALLLKKIEELTLYILDLQKQIDQLKKNKQ